MARYIPITKQHLKGGWKRFDNYNHAVATPVLSVVLSELTHVMAEYPLALAKLPQGGYALCVLLGLRSDENLFVDPQGRWHGKYVPSHLRGYPFAFIKTGSGQNVKSVLCIDGDSGLFRSEVDAANDEQRFF